MQLRAGGTVIPFPVVVPGKSPAGGPGKFDFY